MISGDETRASSAEPTCVEPKTLSDEYGLTELQIDDAIIWNTPA